MLSSSHKSSNPYKYANSCAILSATPKNCKVSAGIVAAIASPPGNPAKKEAPAV